MKASHLMLIGSSLLFTLIAGMHGQAPGREKVAEGRYKEVQNATFTKNVDHAWILWRTAVGYELEDRFTDSEQYANRILAAMGGDTGLPMSPELREQAQSLAVADKLVVETSSDLRINSLRLQGKQLKGKNTKDVNILDCESLGEEAKCKGFQGNRKLKTGVARELYYAFPFPLLFGGFVRQSKRDPEHSEKVELAKARLDKSRHPAVVEAEAEIKYLGQDDLQIGDHVFHTDKYQFRVSSKEAPMSESMIWAYSNGLVIGVEVADRPGVRMLLMEYKKFSDF